MFNLRSATNELHIAVIMVLMKRLDEDEIYISNKEMRSSLEYFMNLKKDSSLEISLNVENNDVHLRVI